MVPVLPPIGQLSDAALRGGAALDDAAEQVGHDERRVGADGVFRLGAVLFEHVAFAVGDLRTQYGRIRTPWFGNTE